MTAYLEAENAYAEERMAPTAELQKTLYDEILGRIQETDQSAPYRKGAFEYYHRTQEGKQYRSYCRREPGKSDTEQVLLDMNALAEGRPFLGLGVYEVSPDGRYLAFSLDETGFRDYTLQIKDLRSGEVLSERMEKVKSAAWASDSKTLFYTVDDDTKRPHQILRHQLGATAEDALIYQEDDERFRVAVWRSRSGKYVFRGVFSHTTSEIAFLSASEPAGTWRVVAERKQDHEYDVAHRGGDFLIRTNDRGRNFRVVRAPVDNPGPLVLGRAPGASRRSDARKLGCVRGFLRVAGARKRSSVHSSLALCRRRFASGRDRRAGVLASPRHQRRVLDGRLSLSVRVSDDAGLGVRLRRSVEGATLGEADRGARRIRPIRVRIGAALGDGARWDAGSGFGRLQEGHTEGRLRPDVAGGLRVVRLSVPHRVFPRARELARSWRDLRDRTHPWRR